MFLYLLVLIFKGFAIQTLSSTSSSCKSQKHELKYLFITHFNRLCKGIYLLRTGLTYRREISASEASDYLEGKSTLYVTNNLLSQTSQRWCGKTTS